MPGPDSDNTPPRPSLRKRTKEISYKEQPIVPKKSSEEKEQERKEKEARREQLEKVKEARREQLARSKAAAQPPKKRQKSNNGKGTATSSPWLQGKPPQKPPQSQSQSQSQSLSQPQLQPSPPPQNLTSRQQKIKDEEDQEMREMEERQEYVRQQMKKMEEMKKKTKAGRLDSPKPFQSSANFTLHELQQYSRKKRDLERLQRKEFLAQKDDGIAALGSISPGVSKEIEIVPESIIRAASMFLSPGNPKALNIVTVGVGEAKAVGGKELTVKKEQQSNPKVEVVTESDGGEPVRETTDSVLTSLNQLNAEATPVSAPSLPATSTETSQEREQGQQKEEQQTQEKLPIPKLSKMLLVNGFHYHTSNADKLRKQRIRQLAPPNRAGAGTGGENDGADEENKSQRLIPASALLDRHTLRGLYEEFGRGSLMLQRIEDSVRYFLEVLGEGREEELRRGENALFEGQEGVRVTGSNTGSNSNMAEATESDSAEADGLVVMQRPSRNAVRKFIDEKRKLDSEKARKRYYYDPSNVDEVDVVDEFDKAEGDEWYWKGGGPFVLSHENDLKYCDPSVADEVPVRDSFSSESPGALSSLSMSLSLPSSFSSSSSSSLPSSSQSTPKYGGGVKSSKKMRRELREERQEAKAQQIIENKTKNLSWSSNSYKPLYTAGEGTGTGTSRTRSRQRSKQSQQQQQYQTPGETYYRTWCLTERWRPLAVGELVCANIDSRRGIDADSGDPAGNFVLAKVEMNEGGVGFEVSEGIKKRVRKFGVLEGVYGMSEVKLRRSGLGGIGDVCVAVKGEGEDDYRVTEPSDYYSSYAHNKGTTDEFGNYLVKISDVEDTTAPPRYLPRCLILPLPTSFHSPTPYGSISSSRLLGAKKGVRIYAMYPSTTAFYGCEVFDNTNFALKPRMYYNNPNIQVDGKNLPMRAEEIGDDAVLLTFDGDDEYTQFLKGKEEEGGTDDRPEGKVVVPKATKNGHPVHVVPARFCTIMPKGDLNYGAGFGNGL